MLIQGRKWDCGEEAATVLLEEVNTGTRITQDYYRGIWRIIQEHRGTRIQAGGDEYRDEDYMGLLQGHLENNTKNI